MLLQIWMQFTGVDKFFRGKISQYKKCIFLKKKVTKDWHYLQSTASISPPELAFQGLLIVQWYEIVSPPELAFCSQPPASELYIYQVYIYATILKYHIG